MTISELEAHINALIDAKILVRCTAEGFAFSTSAVCEAMARTRPYVFVEEEPRQKSDCRRYRAQILVLNMNTLEKIRKEAKGED